MKVEVVDAARKAYASPGNAVTLGAVLHEGECHPEPLVQIPLAMLADRFDRRRMLMACFVVALVCPALLPLTLSSGPLMWAVLVAWGGATMAIYTMSLAVMGDSVPRAELAGANAAFVMMYELGSIGGPAVAGGAMDLAGPNGLMVVLGLIAGGYLAVVGLLQARR